MTINGTSTSTQGRISSTEVIDRPNRLPVSQISAALTSSGLRTSKNRMPASKAALTAIPTSAIRTGVAPRR